MLCTKAVFACGGMHQHCFCHGFSAFFEHPAHRFGRNRVHYLQGHQLPAEQLQRPARATGRRRARLALQGRLHPLPDQGLARPVHGHGGHAHGPPPSARRSRPVPPAPGRRAARSGPAAGAGSGASRRPSTVSGTFVPRSPVQPGSACGTWGLSATREGCAARQGPPSVCRPSMLHPTMTQGWPTSNATKLSWRWNYTAAVPGRGTEAAVGGMAKRAMMTAIPPLNGSLHY